MNPVPLLATARANLTNGFVGRGFSRGIITPSFWLSSRTRSPVFGELRWGICCLISTIFCGVKFDLKSDRF